MTNETETFDSVDYDDDDDLEEGDVLNRKYMVSSYSFSEQPWVEFSTTLSSWSSCNTSQYNDNIEPELMLTMKKRFHIPLRGGP